MVTVKLWAGEQDGMSFEMPRDWDSWKPPLHTWVLTILGERELASHVVEPNGLRDRLTTCAYRFVDFVIEHETNETIELHYERDPSADITPGADLHST